MLRKPVYRILQIIVIVASGGLADALAAEPVSIAVEPTEAKLIGKLSVWVWPPATPRLPVT